MNRPLPATLACLLLLAACDKSPSASSSAAERAPPAAPQQAQAAEVAAIPGKGMLQLDPATLQSCEPAVVKLKWDASSAHPELAAVEVHAIAPRKAADKLFAAGSAIGEATTGPWAKPGHVFQLRDVAGNELDRIVLGGPHCE